MILKLHGVSIAILGENDQPNVDIVCTSTAVDINDRYNKTILEDQTFTLKAVNIKSKAECRDAFICVGNNIMDIVNLQEDVLQKHALKFRPVPVVIGSDCRVSYPVDDIESAFFFMGIYCNKDDNASFSKKFIQTMDKCYLSYGAYNVPNYKPTNYERAQGVLNKDHALNEALKELKPSFQNPETKKQTLDFLTFMGEDYGRSLYTQNLNCNVNYWITPLAPVDNYQHDIAARNKSPIYEFATWDPKIREAILRGFTVAAHENDLKLTVNCNYRAPCEESSPPFTDVTSAMIWDQIDVLCEKKEEKDIEGVDQKFSKEALKKYVINPI